MEIVTSTQNKTVKLFRSLSEKKFREREGLFPAEGGNILRDIPASAAVRFVLATEDRAAEAEERFPGKVIVVSDEVMKSVSGTVTPYGLEAAVVIPVHGFALPAGNAILLDGVSDPGKHGWHLPLRRPRGGSRAGGSACHEHALRGSRYGGGEHIRISAPRSLSVCCGQRGARRERAAPRRGERGAFPSHDGRDGVSQRGGRGGHRNVQRLHIFTTYGGFMSGHSKWHNIQQKKGKSDAARANVFTKIGREIAVAVKQGGPDPNSNSKLRDAIAKAKANNMPNDNISRSIKKASGELGSINYEDMTYEGYGVGGTAFIVEALTDNKNRTAGDVRHLFDKYGGSLGATGCVSFMFKRKGVIAVAKSDIAEDDLMMFALDAGAEDILSDDEEVFEVITAPADLGTVRDELEKNGVKLLSAEVDMIPENTVEPDEAQQTTLLKMIDKLEELDDVQNVYHNAVITIGDDEEE